MVGADTSSIVRLSTPAHHALVTGSLRPTGELPALPAHALAALDAPSAALLLPALRGRSAIAAARDVPPAVLRPHWLGLARAHAAALKERPSAEYAAALAALVAAARPFPALGGSAVAAVAAVTSSAVSYMGNALSVAAKAAGGGSRKVLPIDEPAGGVADGGLVLDGSEGAVEEGGVGVRKSKDMQVTAEPHVVAVLALGLAVAEVAPQQLRRQNHAGLERALWTLLENSRSGDVRSGAANLLAALPSCQPANLRVEAMSGLIKRVSQALLKLATALSPFQPGAPAGALLGPDAAQDGPQLLISRFDGLCMLLTASVTNGFEDPVPVLAHAVVTALLEILDFVAVDPFMPEKGKVDVAMVAKVVASWRITALEALSLVLTALGRAALLPYSARISRSVALVLTSSIRVSRSAKSNSQRMQSAAGLAERKVGYQAALASIQVLGSTAVEAILPALFSCLSVDLPLASAASLVPTRGSPPQAPSLVGIDDHIPRPRKRQRTSQRRASALGIEEARAGKETFSSADYNPPELRRLAAAPLAHARINATVHGLLALEAIFNSRCLISADALVLLGRLELLLVSSLASRGDVCVAVVRTLSSCILSGGSGRATGHCTPILNVSIAALRRLPQTRLLDKSLLIEVRNTLAACETLVHTRGPDVVSSMRNAVSRANNNRAIPGPSSHDIALPVSVNQETPTPNSVDLPTAALEATVDVGENGAPAVGHVVGAKATKDSPTGVVSGGSTDAKRPEQAIVHSIAPSAARKARTSPDSTPISAGARISQERETIEKLESSNTVQAEKDMMPSPQAIPGLPKAGAYVGVSGSSGGNKSSAPPDLSVSPEPDLSISPEPDLSTSPEKVVSAETREKNASEGTADPSSNEAMPGLEENGSQRSRQEDRVDEEDEEVIIDSLVFEGGPDVEDRK